MPDDAVKCAPDDAVKFATDEAVKCTLDDGVKSADDGTVVDVDETASREAVETPADLCEDLASLEAEAIGEGRAMFWTKGGSRLKSYFNCPICILRYIWHTE